MWCAKAFNADQVPDGKGEAEQQGAPQVPVAQSVQRVPARHKDQLQLQPNLISQAHLVSLGGKRRKEKK